jgi:hypothetical protein
MGKIEKEGNMITDWLNKHGNSDIEALVNADALYLASYELSNEIGVSIDSCMSVLKRFDYDYDIAKKFLTDNYIYPWR